MIVRKPHPDDPARVVFVPLVLDRQRQQWQPMQDKGRPLAFENQGDALKLVLAYHLDGWRELHEQLRLVRALSEHPGFDFSGDGIDADMVKRQVLALAARAEMLDAVLPRVLDEPTDADTVTIGDGLRVLAAGFDGAVAPEL